MAASAWSRRRQACALLVEAVDVRREDVDLVLGQRALERWHDTIASDAQAVCDLRLGSAVEPDAIRQVGRTQSLVALAVGPVADGAVGGKVFLTRVQQGFVGPSG